MPLGIVLVLFHISSLHQESIQDLPNSLRVLGLSSIRVIDIRQRHPVKLARRTHRVRAHFSPSEPVTDFQARGQRDDLTDTVDRVAGGTPDRRLFHRVVAHGGAEVDGERDVGWRRARKSRNSGFERVGDGERVWVDDLVVKHDAVESPVDAVVDVVWNPVEVRPEPEPTLTRFDLHITSAPSPSSF